jgi:hypothetical protein
MQSQCEAKVAYVTETVRIADRKVVERADRKIAQRADRANVRNADRKVVPRGATRDDQRAGERIVQRDYALIASTFKYGQFNVPITVYVREDGGWIAHNDVIYLVHQHVEHVPRMASCQCVVPNSQQQPHFPKDMAPAD